MAQLEWKEVPYFIPSWKASSHHAEYNARSSWFKNKFVATIWPLVGYKRELGFFPSIEEAQKACQDWEDEQSE